MSKTLRKVSTWMGDRLENNEVIQANLHASSCLSRIWMKKVKLGFQEGPFGAYVTHKDQAF
jgi:hypothetical protein